MSKNNHGRTLVWVGVLLIMTFGLIWMGQSTQAVAQENSTPTPESTPQVDAPLAVRSGRYALEVPTGWYASVERLFANLQVLPSDVMTLADSEATIDFLAEDSEYNLKEIENLQGAILLATIWPSRLLADNAITNDAFEADFADQLTNQYADTLREAVQLRGISGTRYTYTAPGSVHCWAYFLNDPDGHLMMIFAASDDAHQADVTATLDSLTYFAFSAEDLLNPAAARYNVMVISGVLTLEIPLGWWILPGEGSLQAVVSNPQAAQFAGPLFSNASGETGLVITALQVVRPAVDLSTPSAPEATPVPPPTAQEIAETVATYIFYSDVSRVQSVTDWQNEAGLTGWVVQLTTDLGNTTVLVYVLLIENGDSLDVVGAIADADNALDYAPLVEAIFSTAQHVTPE